MNIFQQLIKSTYSPETIAKFRMAKIGRTILYVFLLMLIASLPAFIGLSITISSLFQAGNDYLDEIPDFDIENGVLQSDLDEPYINDENDMTLVFDSTGELGAEDADQYGNVVALLERELVFSAGGQADRFTYQEIGLDLSKQEIEGFFTTLDDVSLLIISIVLAGFYLFNTALKFIGIFALSAVALLLKRNKADQLRYRHCWVLAAYTVTLPTLLLALLELIGFPLPFPISFIVYWAIAIIMLYNVFKYVPSPKKAPE
ncbi:DUF1189 domain-containing protein [Bacillus daqingensis]|uniref:DUF1189 domain-containing protein n=1 Tax=Bacillus daqingensis TaxID=872396 RepID=A0ABV9P1X6_9BACI